MQDWSRPKQILQRKCLFLITELINPKDQQYICTMMKYLEICKDITQNLTSTAVKINTFWKMDPLETSTRYEYTRLGFIETVYEQQRFQGNSFFWITEH